MKPQGPEFSYLVYACKVMLKSSTKIVQIIFPFGKGLIVLCYTIIISYTLLVFSKSMHLLCVLNMQFTEQM